MMDDQHRSDGLVSAPLSQIKAWERAAVREFAKKMAERRRLKVCATDDWSGYSEGRLESFGECADQIIVAAEEWGK